MDSTTIIVLAGAVVLVVLLTFVMWVVFRNLPFADGTVFRASRLSRGNRLFPTQVAVTPTSVVHYTPHWIGAHEFSFFRGSRRGDLTVTERVARQTLTLPLYGFMADDVLARVIDGVTSFFRG